MYKPQTFKIPELDGISTKTMDDHIDLYEGYVKNFNAISSMLPEYAKDTEKHAQALSELIRRRAFEFDGMRLHEIYFRQFEDGRRHLDDKSDLHKAIEAEYHKPEYFLEMFKAIGNMRGPGWAMLYWDPVGRKLLTGFSGDQQLGHFATLPIIIALDVWEHAFLLDYGALGKAKYLDAFFKNLNWSVIAQRFVKATA